MASIAKFDEWQNSNGTKYGTVLQVVSSTKTNIFTTTSVSYVGIPGLSVVITPSSITNKVLVNFHINAGTSNTTGAIRIYRNSTPIAIGDAVTTHQWTVNVYNGGDDSNSTPGWSMSILDTPSTTSPVTYQIYAGLVQGSGTMVVNDQTSQIRGQTYSGTSASTITAMEIQA
jgi:hypothetical protein